LLNPVSNEARSKKLLIQIQILVHFCQLHYTALFDLQSGVCIRLPAERSLLLQRFRCIELIHDDFNELDFSCTRKRCIIEEPGKLSLVTNGVILRVLPIRITEDAEQTRPVPIGDVIIFPEGK
jgi:hypothetical protein